MGGKVFSEPKGDLPALHTPRMSLEEYNRIRDFSIKHLQDLFEVVLAPAEAPGKPDYGDVDTLVEGPREGFSWEVVKARLKACRHVRNGDSHSFAVPIHSADKSQNSNDINGDTNTGKPDTYAQIDVHLCHPGFMEWECLLDSYGDMWQIIGRFIRPIGLTATDKGLHVRIPEIEPWNRAASLVYLTHSVPDVLDFLGLDALPYHAGFKDRDELYSWCASGKFFHSDAIKPEVANSNDRQRMRKRAMFKVFHEEWMPKHRHLWDGKDPASRDDVLQRALVRFGKIEEYERRIAEWKLKKEEEQLWSEVLGVVKEEYPGDTRVVVRSLKRWVRFDRDDNRSVQPIIRTEAEMNPDSHPRWASQLSGGKQPLSKISLLEWVRKNWKGVKELEKQRVTALKGGKS